MGHLGPKLAPRHPQSRCCAAQVEPFWGQMVTILGRRGLPKGVAKGTHFCVPFAAPFWAVWGCPFGANWCPFGAFGGALGSKTRPWCHFGGLRALCVRPGGFQGSQKAPMGAYVGPKSVELGAMLAPKGSILGPPRVDPMSPIYETKSVTLKKVYTPLGWHFGMPWVPCWPDVGCSLRAC